MTQKFGTTPAEEDLEQIQECRDIVKTILDYGVTQEQIILIIQFLGAELERHEHMVEVVTMARELQKEHNSLLFINRQENGNGSSD